MGHGDKTVGIAPVGKFWWGCWPLSHMAPILHLVWDVWYGESVDEIVRPHADKVIKILIQNS